MATSIRPAMRSRQASIPAGGASCRAPRLSTHPVATIRRASALRSASAPPGLASPRGARTRTWKRQREPARRASRGPGRTLPKSSYQASCSSRPRTASGWAASPSTRKRKRVRRGSTSGSDTTVPAMATTPRSSAGGNCACSAQPACSAAQPAPASNAPLQGTRLPTQSASPASSAAQRNQGNGSAGIHSTMPMPARKQAAVALPSSGHATGPPVHRHIVARPKPGRSRIARSFPPTRLHAARAPAASL